MDFLIYIAFGANYVKNLTMRLVIVEHNELCIDCSYNADIWRRKHEDSAKIRLSVKLCKFVRTFSVYI